MDVRTGVPCAQARLNCRALFLANRATTHRLALMRIGTLVAAGASLALSGCASIRPPANVRPVLRTMETTAYCACGKCCGWTRNWYGRPVVAAGPRKGHPKKVGLTAGGTKARKGTIAADTSRYPFGTVMFVEGYGYGIVEDRGGAIRGDRLDLFFPSHGAALQWGRRVLPVTVWLR